MRARPAPALWLYAGLALGGCLAGVLLGRPELVAVGAAPALMLLVGISGGAPRVVVTAHLEHTRLVEGEEVPLALTVESAAAGEAVITLELPVGLVAAVPGTALRLRPGQPQTWAVALRAQRWGAYEVGSGVARVSGPAGLVMFEQRWECPSPLRVFPTAERLRALVAPFRTQLAAGQRVARAAGEGIEFAELRPLYPGDSLRTVNWRASARRQALVTNQRHPERNADVVLFCDTFAASGAGPVSSLERQVRAAAAIAAALLRRRDRVGVIGFGGIVSWLRPGTGMRQWYRLVDTLLGMRVVVNEAWKGVEVLPLRALPPQSLVLALTPLLDQRSIGALLDLRGRGFDVAVVEVPALPPVSRGAGDLGDVAWRLWRLERANLRQRFQRSGVALVEWSEHRSAESVLAEVIAFRRVAQRAPV